MHKNYIFRLVSLLLTFCAIFTSCTAKAPDSMSVGNAITAESADSVYHTASSDTERVASSDYLQMYIDKKTFAVSINDKTNNYTWNSLPGKSNDLAFTFGVTLYTTGGIYRLNTQDNSVCFGTASYEKSDNGVTVSYVLSDSKETASKDYEEITKTDAYVAFTVSYTLYEQTMTVNIDTKNMLSTPKSVVSEISVLPYLGASYDDSVNDYFLIPDGSGAVMYTSSADADTASVSVNVYGDDPYFENAAAAASATVPVFGVKRNNNAFAAIITQGDAQAVINANRKTETSPSAVGAVFTVTPVKADEESEKIYYGQTYTDNITAVYKFCAGSKADYIGMALSAREEFINNGTLSSQEYNDNDNGNEIPFCISVVGYQDDTAMTTIQQTTDILGILKGKGIDNIQLIYKGLLSGGFAQRNLYSADILSDLGGRDSYEELYSYTEMLNYTLLTDVNIFSSGKNYLSSQSAYSLFENKQTYTLANDLGYRAYKESRLSTRIGSDIASSGYSKRNPAAYSAISGYSMYLSDLSSLKENFSAFLSRKLFSFSDGLSVSDAGYILFSDNNSTRQENMNTISSMIKAAGSSGILSVKGGNLYTLYSADYVSDMEFDTFYPESSAYEPVPFVQAIIHSGTSYSSEPIDAGDPLYRYDMLRYIEYGAVPAFEWVYDASSIFCYDGYLLNERITEITEFYKKANSALASVAAATITGHKKITHDSDGKSVTGVYCTSYSNGSEIYVNYTGTAVVTPENIVVGAYDFVKVTR